MRIGISELFVRPTPGWGAESMLSNVTSGIARAMGPHDQISVFTNLERKPRDARVRYVPVPGGRHANRFVQEAAVLPRYARDLDTLLLGNYFTPPVMPRVRLATIIHDLQQVHMPDNFSAQKRLWMRLSQLATMRLADAVITLSGFSRDDILEVYGSRFEDKVHVIPNPIVWSRYEQSGEPLHGRWTEGWPYLLSVSAQYPHKNLETLIRAFSLFHTRLPDVRLVLVGQRASRLTGTARQSQVETLIGGLELEDAVILTGFVDDAELGEWYRHASLFVFPSLFEGFGMPPVEAMGMGVPTLTTRCGSLPEVTMELAQYVDDPRSPTELAERAVDMIQNRAAFAISASTVNRIRSEYDVDVIGRRYYDLLAGEVR